MNEPLLAEAVYQVVEKFIEFIFASILFSCVASFVSMPMTVRRRRARTEIKETAVLSQVTLALLDQVSRVMIALIASLYFYLIFRLKILPEFPESKTVQAFALLFASSAAICGGWYLFSKIEYYAMGILLLVSALCCAVTSYICKNDATATFLYHRSLWHGATGCLILFAGIATQVWPLRIGKLIQFSGWPVSHAILRVLIGIWIIIMVFLEFYAK